MTRRTADGYAPPNRRVAKLLDRIAATLREYLDQPRTDLLRAAGADVADLRALFTRNDAPDWSGRSREYRDAMTEIYNRLNVHGKDRENLQFNVRFHAGNVIRERADAGELEAAGLDTVSPRDRIQRKRDAALATAAAVGVRAGAAESLPRVMAWAATLLEYALSLDVAQLTKREKAACRALVKDCRACLDALDAQL